MRNAFVVVMAMGGSTNVVLHGPEIARAAGFDLWADVLSQQEFNAAVAPAPGAREHAPLRGVLDGRRRRDRRRRRHRQGAARRRVRSTDRRSRARARRWPSRSSGSTRRRPTARSILPVGSPFKPTGGLRLLRGNLAPDGGAILKLAGSRAASSTDGSPAAPGCSTASGSLIAALEDAPESLPRRRHRRRPLRGPPRRAGHARDARSDVAHHRAVPAQGHHDRAHDRRRGSRADRSGS